MALTGATCIRLFLQLLKGHSKDAALAYVAQALVNEGQALLKSGKIAEEQVYEEQKNKFLAVTLKFKLPATAESFAIVWKGLNANEATS